MSPSAVAFSPIVVPAFCPALIYPELFPVPPCFLDNIFVTPSLTSAEPSNFSPDSLDKLTVIVRDVDSCFAFDTSAVAFFNCSTVTALSVAIFSSSFIVLIVSPTTFASAALPLLVNVVSI